MPPRQPADLRAHVDRLIGNFHGPDLSAAKRFMPTREELKSQVPGALLASAEEGATAVGKYILRNAPAAMRGAEKGMIYAGKAALKTPAAIYGVAEAVRNRDNPRELAKLAGGAVGQVMLGGLGSLAGPVGTVAGGAAGGIVGERAGEYLYDHYKEIPGAITDAVTRGWGLSADPRVRSTLMGPRYR